MYNVTVPIDWIKELPAGSAWGSRERDDNWVAQLESKIKKEATIPANNILLCCDWQEMAESRPVMTKEKASTMMKEIAKHGLYAYSGEHSRAALKHFSEKHPTNEYIRQISTSITFVNLKDKDDVNMILQLGFRANQLSSFTKSIDHSVHIIKIHKILEDDNCLTDPEQTLTDWPIEKNYLDYFMTIFNMKANPPSAAPGQEDSKEYKAILDKFNKETAKKMSTMRHLVSVGRCYGEEWKAILANKSLQEAAEKTADRETGPKASKVNFWWYQPLVSVPRSIRLDIIAKSVTPKQPIINQPIVKKLVNEYKAKERVRLAVVKQFNDKCQALSDKYKLAQCFDDVILQIPKLNDNNFIQPYYFSALSMSGTQAMPDEFNEKIYNIMCLNTTSDSAGKERMVTFIFLILYSTK